MTQRSEFLACYSQGRRYFSNRFIVFALPNATPNSALRSGAGVGKKTGTATRRNRVKRLIREFFRQYGASIGPGLDVVVVPKRGIDVQALTFDNFSRELIPVLRRAVADIARLRGCDALGASNDQKPGDLEGAPAAN